MGREARLTGRVLALTVLAAAACSRDEAVLRWSAPAGPLRIVPSAATVVVGGADPVVVEFTALRDGGDRLAPATDGIRWSTDQPDLVQVDARGRATVLSARGGEAVIVATDGREVGTARLTVKVGITAAEEGVPPEAAALFRAPPDAERAPEIVYPDDGVMVPPNLPRLEVHFRPRGGTTLYEIELGNDRTEVRLHARCRPVDGGCAQPLDGALWALAAESNRGARLRLTVRATDEEGGRTGVSASRSVWVGAENLRGTLYYGTGPHGATLMRSRPGDPFLAGPERVLSPELTREWVAVHALAADASRVVASTGAVGGPGRSLVLDLVARTTRFLGRRLQGAALGLDGGLIVGVAGDGPWRGPKDFVLFDARDGAERGMLPLRGMRGAHPDVSADRRRVVFCSVDLAGSYPDHRPGMGGIAYLDRDGTDWTSPRTVMGAVPGSNFHSPALAPPAGAWAVFVESVCSAGTYDATCDADADPVTRLWLAPVPLPPGRRARPLDALNRPGPLDGPGVALALGTPRFHPQTFRGPDGRALYWLIFASSRRPGLWPGPRDPADAAGTLLWMAAIDPAELEAGRDPSFAPFLVPYQDQATSNGAGQWVADGP